MIRRRSVFSLQMFLQYPKNWENGKKKILLITKHQTEINIVN